MSIYSYVLRYDDGVAPNPYYGYCTLAVCKPVIRRKAQVGDWIIGTGSKENVNLEDDIPRIIYAMRVQEVLPLTAYYDDPRFEKKKPRPFTTLWTGDNFYRNWDKNIIQMESVHSNADSSENLENKEHDLSGINVLISENFKYWGRKAIKLPDEFQNFVKKGQAHKKITDETLISKFEKWYDNQHPPFKMVPCQPLFPIDESGDYIFDKMSAVKCFRVDCKPETEEEII
ncbi:MAG: Nmad2 family putative nucleotide modification protein [Ignavibacteriaceae bacterium]